MKKKLKNILFIWVPKTAGTSIFSTLKLNNQIANGNFKYNFNNYTDVTFGHADINILLKQKVISQEFYDNSFKFCIVRNPYDRAVSLFHYLKLNKKYSFKLWVKYLYENKNNIPKNSTRNVTYYKDINNQWNTMSSWIPNDIDKIILF